MHNTNEDHHSRAALPLAPALDSTLVDVHMPRQFRTLGRRILWISTLAVLLGSGVAVAAYALTGLIGLITNLAFYGRWDFSLSSPADNQLGLWVILVPAVGGIIVGIMARYGSGAIRGHGIPEAMEQVLLNESRIKPRLTWLKPVSSAVAIGSGGPFGAEGPIIATGGALGSLIGQLLHVTGQERKVLLAAAAAGGMTAIFAAPVSAVVVAGGRLLVRLRARSLIPVALAAVAGTALRYVLEGNEPMFPMPTVAAPGFPAIGTYVVLGLILGVVSVAITRLTYAIEDGFAKLPIHWMWWPALGGLVVGCVGYVMPMTLGVGYGNITAVISGQLGLGAMLALCLLKLLSWSVALGSGTSGGTLAPLFTIGGALGGALGIALAHAAPWLGVDPRMAALVCMAAIFAGASRAFLTSVVFAFETTHQVHGLLPLLGACAAAYLVSGLMMRNTIMTEKIARRGVRVPSDYSADYLDQIRVGDACSRQVVSLRDSQKLSEVRAWLGTKTSAYTHQGFPVLGQDGQLRGVLTRRNLLDADIADDERIGQLIIRPIIGIREDHSLREAADHMVEANVGRLIVLDREDATRMVGILTRGDLLAAHVQRLREARHASRHLRRRRKAEAAPI